MKIFFGYPNAGSIDKVSPALQAMGVNMLKAEPGKFNAKGLYTIEQPGYSTYISHIAAYIYATNIQKEVYTGKSGYAINTLSMDLLPISFPPICAYYKDTKKNDVKELKKEFTWREISAKKNETGIVFDYGRGLLQKLLDTDYVRSSFPVADTVTPESYSSVVIITRILSGFLRTHKYPAFKDDDYHMDAPYPERRKRKMRDLTADEYNDEEDTKRLVMFNEAEGEIYGMPILKETGGLKISLRKAKPSETETIPWGNSTEIPTTGGIVFPYLPDLAKNDKNTVPDVLGAYFTRCFGDNSEECLTAYGEMCQNWKKEIYLTRWGDIMSHLARVIQIGIPAQARIFPVFENNEYKGCYLSGHGYSVAIGRELVKPEAYKLSEMEVFQSNESVLRQIFKDVMGANEETTVKLVQTARVSMRGLEQALRMRNYDRGIMARIKTLAAKLRYPQPYLKINSENIEWFMEAVRSSKELSVETPMHFEALEAPSIMMSALSAFGPSPPSPIIPGARTILFGNTETIPKDLTKPLAYRLTNLKTAAAEWEEVLRTKKTQNAPNQLSSRYQYVAVRGEDERGTWYREMVRFIKWWHEKESGESVDTAVDARMAKSVSRVSGGIDIEGF
jgi:hypothetical protein